MIQIQQKKYVLLNFSFWILLFCIPALILYKTTIDFIDITKYETILGILFQCLTAGYIAWAILYSYFTLQKEKNTFIELIQSNNKEEWFSNEINDIYKGTYTFIILIIIAILLILTPLFLIGNPLPSSSSLHFYITFLTLSLVMGGGASMILPKNWTED
jgi:hypothetical protein